MTDVGEPKKEKKKMHNGSKLILKENKCRSFCINSGVFRTFDLRVLTVIDVPKLPVLKGGGSNRLSRYYGC